MVELGYALNARGQEGQPGVAGAFKPSVAKRDANALLIAARAALERGDLDRADALAAQAEKMPRGLLALIKSKWSDTPAKVRRDIGAAKARETATLMERIQEQEKMVAAAPLRDTPNAALGETREREKWLVFRPGDGSGGKGPELPKPKATGAPAWVPADGAPRNLAAVQDRFLGMKETAIDRQVKKPPLAPVSGGSRRLTLLHQILENGVLSSRQYEDLVKTRPWHSSRKAARHSWLAIWKLPANVPCGRRSCVPTRTGTRKTSRFFWGI